MPPLKTKDLESACAPICESRAKIEERTLVDNDSRELLAVHHTGFIVAQAGQIYRQYTIYDGRTKKL